MGVLRKLLGRLPPEDGGADDPVIGGGRDPDDVHPDPRSPAGPAELFALRSREAERLSDGVEEFTLHRQELGRLDPAGEGLVLGDPLAGLERLEVPADGGEVELWWLDGEGRRRVAFACLRLAEAAPESWEHLGEYGVDTGVCCFAARRAIEALDAASARYYSQPGRLDGEEPLVDALEGSDAVMYEIDAQQLACFSSGMGDGVYAAWAGRSATGEVSVVLTSFDIVAKGSVAAAG